MAKVFTITDGVENMGAMKTGGQGSVYKARRIGEIITAIKILPTPIYSESADDKNYTSFQNEVEKLKKVNEEPNPHLVTILSSGITNSGNFPFIEMEFIEGPDLEDLLKPPHDPIFSIKEIVKIADQLSNALAHCHKINVKHGDVKSNNVKFNTKTGNYVLLDFGMAVMSDEQRRTSLRHAGAIEFMAPEQNEGHILFETDVYSFGVVMFELLAGTVPFPLKDHAEISRNNVVLAHLDTPPPDVISIRKQALPVAWSDEKKEREMYVPQWLISMVYKCLEKKPAQRFANGVELHDHVVRNSIITDSKKDWVDDRVKMLQVENEKLLKEKEELRQRLVQYQQNLNATSTSTVALPTVTAKSWFARNIIPLGIIGALAIGAVIYFVAFNKPAVQSTINNIPGTMQPSSDTLNEDVSLRLNEARVYLSTNNTQQALNIYKDLSDKKVPEATFEYANLALQSRNANIDCLTAFDQLISLANKNYSPAKRVAGFLFCFADDIEQLKQENYYERCTFSKNVPRGSKLLMEAMLQGDTVASRLLTELNNRKLLHK